MAEYKALFEAWPKTQEARVSEKQKKLEEQQKLIDEEKEKLAAERVSFAREKERVSQVCAPSEVIEINAGGGIFTVKRSTLCTCEDSMLGAMFSGRWNDKGFCRDAEGRIYLELNRECFEVILEWLRAQSIDPTIQVPAPPPGKEDIFESTVRYLQLEQFMYPHPRVKDLSHAKVAQTSSTGGALGNDPSAIFNQNKGQGWTCETHEADESWIILDLQTKVRFSKVTLSFLSKHAPNKVCLEGSSNASGPWIPLQESTVSTGVCEIRGWHCVQYLWLYFEAPNGPNYIGLYALSLEQASA